MLNKCLLKESFSKSMIICFSLLNNNAIVIHSLSPCEEAVTAEITKTEWETEKKQKQWGEFIKHTALEFESQEAKVFSSHVLP